MRRESSDIQILKGQAEEEALFKKKKRYSQGGLKRKRRVRAMEPKIKTQKHVLGFAIKASFLSIEKAS